MKRLMLIMALLATPLMAVELDEVLDNPVLETRARELSKGLRCLVCRNESIDESHASLAKDLRVLVRERLVAGDTDQEVIDFVVDRYGEYVLLKPQSGGSNWMLWAAGPILLLIALGTGGAYLRRRSQLAGENPLSPEEQARLDLLLKDDADAL